MVSDEPVFLIGNPRSGTTLLRLIVTSHPAIVIPPECGFMIWWKPAYGDWRATDINTTRLDQFVDDIVSSRKFETWHLPAAVVREHLRDAAPESYAALCAAVYACFVARHKPAADMWGDKNNFHVTHVGDLHALFPACRVVHIVRDPRDVACSYRDMSRVASTSPYTPRLPVDAPTIGAEWLANVTAVRAGIARMPADRVKEIRYEDLVQTPGETAASLCAFLGRPFDAGMLNYHESNADLELEPREFLAWKAKTLEPPDPSTIGRHRTQLPAADVAAISRITRDLLSAYGYAP